MSTQPVATSNPPASSQGRTSTTNSGSIGKGLFYINDEWQLVENLSPERVIETAHLRRSGTEIMFLPSVGSSKIKNNSKLQTDISSLFHVPKFFWSKSGYEANGFYSHKENPLSNFNGLSYSTMSRFLIKEIDHPPGKKPEYQWQYISFISLCCHPSNEEDNPTQILLCFDLSPKMQDLFMEAFRTSDPSSWINCPLGVYSVIIPEISICFDEALWGFREPIRRIEKTRINPMDDTSLDLDMIQKIQRRYEGMHELSRHVIHEIETLQISARTFETLARGHEQYSHADGHPTLCDGNCSADLQFYQRFLENLHYRAIAFRDRLKNEIVLAFNLSITQDNSLTKQTLEDGKELTHLVSTATLLFLPGSFISSIFGMNFFDFGQTKIQTSDQIYIFVISTVVVTAIAFAIYTYGEPLRKFWVGLLPKLRRKKKRGTVMDTESTVGTGLHEISSGKTFGVRVVTQNGTK